MKTLPMKRNSIWGLCIALCLLSLPAWAGWGSADLRRDVRFLTDRMAYELRLSPQQYDDVYEVNYDFLAHVAPLRVEVMYGYRSALDRYYDCLDIRNDDLRWILSSSQYRRFLKAEHFYRPYCSHQSRWQLRIYLVYTDVHHFYFGKPHHYLSYCGGHYRTHFHNVSYYRTHRHPHYRHAVFDGHFRIRKDRFVYDRHSRRDFPVSVRPQSRPDARPSHPGIRPNRGETRPNHRPEERPSRPEIRPSRPHLRPDREELKPQHRPEARPQRPVRPQRPERPNRVERPARPNRSERSNRVERCKESRRESRQQRSDERQQRRIERELYRTL